MHIYSLKIFQLKKIPQIIVLSFVTIIVQIGIILKFGDFSVLLISGINFFLFLSLIYYIQVEHLSSLLIILNLIPLIYFSTPFHYGMFTIVIQDIVLFVVIGFALIVYFKNDNFFEFKFSYLSLPIAIFILYMSFSVVLGILNNHQYSFIFDEYYHIFYYFLPLIFAYIIPSRKIFFIIFSAIIIIFAIISFENYIFNVFSNISRFVTFQSYMLPLILGIVLSYTLLQQKNLLKRILSFLLFIFVLGGLLVTLTRSLWVSALITIFVAIITYLHVEMKLSKKVITSFLAFALILGSLTLYSMDYSSTSEKENDDVEYRTESIANPGADKSFLMRIELGYYILIKWLENPVIGKGLGDTVQYKFLNPDRTPVIYPDNSWLFFLWKGGLIGFFLFGWIYWRALKIAYLIFLRSKNFYVRILALGIFAGIIGLIPFGLFNAMLIKYKTNVILAIVLGFLIFESTNFDYLKDEKNHFIHS